MTQHEYFNVVRSNKELDIFENVKQLWKKFKKLPKKNKNFKEGENR